MRTQKAKNPSLFVIVVIFLVICACNLPVNFNGKPPVEIVTISEMFVSPPSGKGEFTLSFKYVAPVAMPYTISCYYVTPDNQTIGIVYVDEPAGKYSGEKTENFTVSSSGRKSESGVYVATCMDGHGKSVKTAIFRVIDDSLGDVSVIDVEVTGGQNYSYALGFQYIISIPDPVTFTCNYVAPDGATILIGNYTDAQPIEELKKTSMYFSVKKPDGKVIPGLYTATCQDDEGRSNKSTTFSVSEEATPTPTPTPTITPTRLPTITSTQKPTLTGGMIHYDETTQNLSPRLDKGFWPHQFHKWCSPVVTFAADGAFNGSCFSSADPVNLKLYGTWFGGGATIEGKITGNVSSDGKITFRETLTEQWKPTSGFWSTRTVVFEGSGSFTSATQAKGTAKITAECSAYSPDASHCGLHSARDQFTGTISWEFIGTSTR